MQPLLNDPTFPLVVALAVIVFAGVWEAFTFRVPNALTLTACVAGLIFAVAKSFLAPDAAGGLLPAIIGLVVGGATLLPLKTKLGVGSGCIKAEAAFGVWVGCAVGVGTTLVLLTISAVVGMLVLFLYTRAVPHKTNICHAQFPITVGVVTAVAVMLVVR